jgi:hypothetical protein
MSYVSNLLFIIVKRVYITCNIHSGYIRVSMEVA